MAAGRTVSATLILTLVVFAAPASASAGEFSACRALESWPDAEVESFLLEAEVVRIEDLGVGITKPKRITLRRGDLSCRAIYKDINENSPDIALTDRFELGFSDRYAYEVAAYRVDRLLGIGLVPVTVLREVEGRPGSLQLWIEDVTTLGTVAGENRTVSNEALLLKQLMSMYVLDALIGNVDRTFENILVRPEVDDLFLIDHSRAFRVSGKVTPPSDTVTTPVSGRLVEAVTRLDRRAIDEALGPLLTKRQRSSILKRRDRLVGILRDRHLMAASDPNQSARREDQAVASPTG